MGGNGSMWYHFMIDVVNPDCDHGAWMADGYFQSLRCDLSWDRNRWQIEIAEEGTTDWKVLSSEGYAIYAPPDALDDQTVITTAVLDVKRVEQQAELKAMYLQEDGLQAEM